MKCRKNSEYTHRFIDLLTHFPHQLHICLLPSHQHDSMFISDTHTHTRLHVASANPGWFLCRWQSFLFQCAFNMISSGFCIKLRREKKIQHSYLRSWTGAVFDPVATISCILALFLCFTLSFSIMLRVHQSISPAFDWSGLVLVTICSATHTHTWFHHSAVSLTQWWDQCVFAILWCN